MKQTDNERALNADPELAELERELAQMADEVPPMPDDFHAKWMSAVRAEAEQARPSEPEKAGDASDGEPEHRAVIITHSRWFKALSMAAVFVFLIGGTFLYRSTRKRLYNVELSFSQVTVTAEPVAESEEEEPVMEAAGEEPGMNTAGEASAPVMETAGEASEASVPAMKTAGEEPEMETAGEEPGMNTAGEASEASAPVMETAGEEPEMEIAGEEPEMEAAGESEGEEPETLFAGAPKANAVYETAGETAREAEPKPAETTVPEAAATAEPTLPAETYLPETAAEPEDAVEAESQGFWQSVGDFMKDMGRFLLAVLPYLLAAAVIIGGIVLVRRRKNR